jgi:hypothetical protein
VPARRAGEEPADEEEGDAEREEAHVVGEFVFSFADVVEIEGGVEESLIEHVEQAPAEKEPAEERAIERDPPAGDADPQPPKTGCCEEPRGGVKEAVGDRVGLESADGADVSLFSAGDHVVPLEELVEDDAVEEPAEPEPEHDPRRDDSSAHLTRDVLLGGGYWEPRALPLVAENYGGPGEGSSPRSRRRACCKRQEAGVSAAV